MKLTSLFVLLGLLLSCVFVSLMAGSVWFSPQRVIDALCVTDMQHASDRVILYARLSRTLLAISVGAFLAVAGLLMQALTRNPLASPGLFGINAGATLFIVVASVGFSLLNPGSTLLVAFLGAACAAMLVWVVSRAKYGAMNPLRMVLAGIAITALFTSFSQAILVMNQESLDTVLLWLAGSLVTNDLTARYLAMGIGGGLLLITCGYSRHIMLLNAGESIARGLGQNIALVRLVVSLLVVGLAGCAVAIAGNIGFIGLIVPHFARKIFGHKYRLLLPGCALCGAILLLAADLLGRVIFLPQEIPVGVMTALIGAPFFIMLAQRGSVHE